MATVYFDPFGDTAYKLNVAKYADGVPPNGTPQWSLEVQIVPRNFSVVGEATDTLDSVLTELAEDLNAVTGIVAVSLSKTEVVGSSLVDENDGD